MMPSSRFIIVGVCFFLVAAAAWAEPVTISEPISDSASYRTEIQVNIKGNLKTPSNTKEPNLLPLEANARFRYREARLPAAGRDDRAWRSLRQYEQAGARIVVEQQVTDLQLSADSASIVAEGFQSGLLLYSPSGPVTRKEVDLLTVAADPLTVLAVLPRAPVDVGEEWTVPEWAAQMMVGIEAATSAKLTGKLISVENNLAQFDLTGEVSGAVTGAATKVKVSGSGVFDLTQQMVTKFEISQQEERGISTISPGMSVTATVSWTREELDASNGLDQQVLQAVPLDPPLLAKLLEFKSKFWNIRFIHDRKWFVFQEIPEVTVLRMVDNGTLISQCNIARIQRAAAGTHVEPERFLRDIQTSLGEQFTEIVDQSELDSDSGNFIYRVVAAGQANDLQMLWVYYLCAGKDGRQVSFVFAVEPDNMEALGGADISIVESLEFLPE